MHEPEASYTGSVPMLPSVVVVLMRPGYPDFDHVCAERQPAKTILVRLAFS